MLATKLEMVQAAKWTTAYINSLPDSSFLVIEGDYKSEKTTDKRARHLPVKDKDGKLDLAHYNNAGARLNQVRPVSGPESAEELRAKAKAAWDKLGPQAEKLRKQKGQSKGSGNIPHSGNTGGHPQPEGSAKDTHPEGGKKKMDELEKLQKAFDELKTENEALRTQLAEAQEADHAKILKAKDAKIGEQAARIGELETQAAEMTTAKTEAEAKVETLQATNEELVKKGEALSTKVEEMEKVEREKKVSERKAQIEALKDLSDEYKEKCVARAEEATDEDWAFVLESATLAAGQKVEPKKDKEDLVGASEEAGKTPTGEADGGDGKSKLGAFLKEKMTPKSE